MRFSQGSDLGLNQRFKKEMLYQSFWFGSFTNAEGIFSIFDFFFFYPLKFLLSSLTVQGKYLCAHNFLELLCSVLISETKNLLVPVSLLIG